MVKKQKGTGAPRRVPSSNWAKLLHRLPPERKRKPSAPAPAHAAAASGAPLPAFPLQPYAAPEEQLTAVLALDCEMVGVGMTKQRSALAQIAIVNSNEQLVYAAYVRPPEKITDYRTRVSGVRHCHMRDAWPFRQVQTDVAKLLKGRVLVGHALSNDLKALLLTHPKHMRRDTALCAAFRSQGAITSHARKLRDLAAEKLGMQIQAGEHSPVEDAIAALRLSKLACAKWDAISVKKPIKLIKGGLKKPKKKVGHRRPYKPGQPPRTA